MHEQKLPVMKVDVYGHYNAGFDSLLMGFRESKVTSYYGADYDHEMLEYCGIIRSWVQMLVGCLRCDLDIC
jgi:hypothetical protein